MTTTKINFYFQQIPATAKITNPKITKQTSMHASDDTPPLFIEAS